MRSTHWKDDSRDDSGGTPESVTYCFQSAVWGQVDEIKFHRLVSLNLSGRRLVLSGSSSSSREVVGIPDKLGGWVQGDEDLPLEERIGYASIIIHGLVHDVDVGNQEIKAGKLLTCDWVGRVVPVLLDNSLYNPTHPDYYVQDGYTYPIPVVGRALEHSEPFGVTTVFITPSLG